jgi:TPR repeat protein
MREKTYRLYPTWFLWTSPQWRGVLYAAEIKLRVLSDHEGAAELLAPAVAAGEPAAVTLRNEFSTAAEALTWDDSAAEKARFDAVTSAANAGFPPAQYLVGRTFDLGEPALGIEKNTVLAAAWLEKAAVQGHVASMHAHACCLLYGADGYEINEAKGLHYLMQAASQGHGPALHLMSRVFGDGLFGVIKDAAVAEYFLECSDDADFLY